MRFLKEDDKTVVKAIDTSMKNRWFEHSFGNFGPIKYKIGECIKKLTFLGLHGVCGVGPVV